MKPTRTRAHAAQGPLNKIRHFLSLVRFSHTFFALPFALAAMFWAAEGWPQASTFALILLAMVFCRNSAMACNRLLDADIDGLNPRTALRHIPAGILKRSEVSLFLFANLAAFIVTTAFINKLAFILSVPTLAIVCFYSLTKRFTSLSHVFLGLAIGISPVGAWIAVTGAPAPEPLCLGLALWLWITGFDIIYATQDYQFDKERKLHSLVVKLGIPRALQVAAILHASMLAVLAAMALFPSLGWGYLSAVTITGAVMVYVHRFRRSNSLDGLNQDFFWANVGISFLVLAGISLSVFGGHKGW